MRLALLLSALLVAVGCRPRSGGEQEAPAQPGEADAGAATPVANEPEPAVHIVYPPAPGEFIALTEQVGRAVVNIRTGGKVTGGPASMYPGARPDSSLGSGFLVDRDNRYVLTSLRLVEPAGELTVVFADGQQRSASTLGRDPALDVALLQLSGPALPEDIVAVRRGESERLRVGEWVLALGNPFGGEVTASAGIISGKGGVSSVNEPPHERFRSMLHTDAAIHRGNTGGPLVNLAGEVVGINATLGSGAGRLGFAVPMSQVNHKFHLLQKGRVAETWLGVFVMPATQANAQGCAPQGVLVTQVVTAGPAARAGLRIGDVITRFDGHAVDEPKLAALARATVPEQRVTLGVCRKGETLSPVLVVEEKPK